MDNIVILIDEPKDGYSHLVSNDILYLHIFAQKLNIKKCWFENKKNKYRPHYDVKDIYFNKAIELGAKLVNSRDIIIFLNKNFKNRKVL